MKKKTPKAEMKQIEMEFKRLEHQTEFFLQQGLSGCESKLNKCSTRIVTTVPNYSNKKSTSK